MNELDLFEKKPRRVKPWESEWVGMPEFVQEKKDCYAKIVFRFDSQKDLDDFSRIIGQKLTKKTKSAWHPFKSHWGGEKKEWVDES